MKVKYLIPFLVFVLIFGFALTSCGTVDENEYSNLEKDIEILKKEIIDLGKDILKLNQSKAQIERRIETLESTTEETREGIIEEEQQKEEEEIAIAINEEFKEQVKKSIEEEFKGKLTKLTYDEDSNTFYLAYNTRWAVEETMQKEVYDITLIFAPNNADVNLDINSTSDMGSIVHAYNSTETLTKIKNYELSYEEWLEIAIK